MSVERMMTAKSIVAFHANANRATLDTVDCSLCGSPDYSLYDSVDEWRIVRCDRCGFCFTNPRPSVESLPYFYDLGYFRDDEVTRFGWVDEERDPHGARSNDYHQRIADIESRLDNRGRLLELGAATGEFLSVMRARGWGQVRKRAWSMFGNRTRLAYSALPVNRGIETSGSAGIE